MTSTATDPKPAQTGANKQENPIERYGFSITGITETRLSAEQLTAVLTELVQKATAGREQLTPAEKIDVFVEESYKFGVTHIS